MRKTMGNLSNESPLLFSEIYLLMPTRQQLNASLHHPFLCEEGEEKKSWTENKRSSSFLGSLASSKNPSRSS
jgi:hypothetical protein